LKEAHILQAKALDQMQLLEHKLEEKEKPKRKKFLGLF